MTFLIYILKQIKESLDLFTRYFQRKLLQRPLYIAQDRSPNQILHGLESGCSDQLQLQNNESAVKISPQFDLMKVNGGDSIFQAINEQSQKQFLMKKVEASQSSERKSEVLSPAQLRMEGQDEEKEEVKDEKPKSSTKRNKQGRPLQHPLFNYYIVKVYQKMTNYFKSQKLPKSFIDTVKDIKASIYFDYDLGAELFPLYFEELAKDFFAKNNEKSYRDWVIAHKDEQFPGQFSQLQQQEYKRLLQLQIDKKIQKELLQRKKQYQKQMKQLRKERKQLQEQQKKKKGEQQIGKDEVKREYRVNTFEFKKAGRPKKRGQKKKRRQKKKKS